MSHFRNFNRVFLVKKSDHLLDIVREVQTEIEPFHSMLKASLIAVQLQDVRISEGDQYLLYAKIGAGGLNIEVASDNEVFKGLDCQGTD